MPGRGFITFSDYMHEQWGTIEVGAWFPTLCGISPLAQPTTTTVPSHVSCPECMKKRRRLEDAGVDFDISAGACP